MSDEKPKASGMQRVAEEAFTPAAKEFGNEIAPLGKATGALADRVGQLLLRSVDHLVYGLEKAEEYIKEALAKRLKDVPKDKIVEPQLRIAVPAMQGLTFSLDEEYIRGMFLNLLAADMNVDTKNDVHPAFVEFIKEMTSLEAKLLLRLHAGEQIEGYIRFGADRKFISHARTYSFARGENINQYPKALDNLDRLGLVDFRDEYPSEFDAWQKEVEQHAAKLFDEAIKMERYAALATVPGAKGLVHYRGIYLTDLGKAFVNVCMKGLS